MKKIISIIAAAFITVNAFAQAPQTMSYQAVVRDNANALVANGPVGMRVSILYGSVLVYRETHTSQTNINGLLSIEIGAGTADSGTYNNGIYWAAGNLFLQTEIDPAGGTDYTITSTSQLLSVPYSNYAQVSGYSFSSPQPHYIGELFQDGIIVSVWQVNGVEHGLIASLTDLSTSADWSSAVSLCDEYATLGINGAPYDDWYLPNFNELWMCFNAAGISQEVLNLDGFQPDSYWTSSTEQVATLEQGITVITTYPRTINFNNGDSTPVPQVPAYAYRVRAVRKF